jgi:hypothetical protein
VADDLEERPDDLGATLTDDDMETEGGGGLAGGDADMDDSDADMDESDADADDTDA